ncbi:NAD(P)-binding domain-containing protein [Pollutimonas harenae]|uniref:Flavin-containing monooxygenase 5 n=1 Tax=Pollutimonas harenae TaxID=657015 RepID=A0A853GX37_9BURK|nr:NAD(P)-binding domain-containing protein [Pollutimonas harenae]NYT84692.1 NAD(P)-binding domain-containing protein [Pollutimonas harenae]TEA72905.1 monooxygenase [Pollutimonas harenae]
MDTARPGPNANTLLPVCIIGAGSSGVAAAKALKEKGVAFECYEIGSNIGGMWRYQNDNGRSSAYRSLHIDTSRKNLGYSDFPIPDHYPDFLSHFEVLEYLESYAKHFEVMEHIQFKTRVERIEPKDDTWLVTLGDGTQKRYRAVLVANGHLWDPRTAQFDGHFNGEQLHSHYYKTSEPFKDKNVLVVGIGNSAVDIAVDVCKGAKSTLLSTRRSAWIMPKYFMGYPMDQVSSYIARTFRLSTRRTRSIMQRLAYLVTGDQTRFGIPRPKHEIWREHATLSQELIPYCGHGWIRVKPNIKQLLGTHVQFEDETTEPVDVIIQATGYKTTFPFLDRSLFEVKDGKVELYRRMLPVDLPGLYMVGLVQPIGPTIPLVEVQARWLASVLSGETTLPSRSVMQEEIKTHNDEIARQYVGSARYTLEVDFRTYAKQLSRDMQSGVAK